jgi:DNA-binding response OmpR family regulator
LKKILLIEDNKDLSAIIKFNLIKSGYEVFNVENANDGLMILDDVEINLILLDLMLPGLSGLEFLKIIKRNEK